MLYHGNSEINILSLVMLIILFESMYHRHGIFLFDQKLFLSMCASVSLLLFLDAVQWIINGRPGILLLGLNWVISIIYFILHTIPCVLWCLYVRYQFCMNEKEAAKATLFLCIPSVVNAFISFMSCFQGFYFSIDENNIYYRGRFFWIFMVITVIYILYAQLYIFINRKKIEKSRYYSLMLFTLPPFVGGTVQSIFYGVALLWPFATLSLLIIYIYIQNNQLYSDHLTGLYNRRLLDIYLDGSLRKAGRGGTIGSILLDIDEFKSINDGHGHTVGDQALIDVAVILKNSVGKDSFVARYGGDEFVIILGSEDVSQIENTVTAIEQNVAQYNRKNTLYQIKLSMGYDLFKCGSGLTKEYLLDRIDSLMYEKKRCCKKPAK